jgi:GrpB-like predicted nucleotidyltransferase (UPF0157 family)
MSSSRHSRGRRNADRWSGERLDADADPALRLRVVAQDDGDELLRLLILAVLAKADRPLDAEELAERVAAMVGMRLVPERGH